MEFKKFSAGLLSYGISDVNNKEAMKKNKEEEDDIQNVNFHDILFYNHFHNENSINYGPIKRLLLNLAICHTIVITREGKKLTYDASSPDELALVNAARFFGVKFVDRDENDNVVIEFRGKTLKFELLNLIEFNSTRKRMTVIVKDEEGTIYVLCKGADSILFPLLRNTDEN